MLGTEVRTDLGDSIKKAFANVDDILNDLKFDIKLCLVKNGYPPQYSPEVFNKVMEQVENFEEHRG